MASIGALRKLRKASFRFDMSVCLSVRPHGTTRLPMDGFFLNEICYSNIFRKSVEIIQVSLICDVNQGYLT